MKYLDIIALILLIVGGLNWLLVGAFNFDLVATISGGATTPLAKIIYIIVGICAIYSIKFLAPSKFDKPRVTRLFFIYENNDSGKKLFSIIFLNHFFIIKNFMI